MFKHPSLHTEELLFTQNVTKPPNVSIIKTIGKKLVSAFTQHKPEVDPGGVRDVHPLFYNIIFILSIKQYIFLT